MMSALEAGAEDIGDIGDAYEVLCSVADFSEVRTSLEERGYTIVSAEIERLSQNKVDVPAESVALVEALLEKLDDHDDVQNVYHNANLPDDSEDE